MAEDSSSRLRVSEVFHSLQGESSRIGLPTVFIRLTGCPLRCTWCDTPYAFQGGESRTLEELLADVAAFDCRHVCVTGGEPLAQKATLALLTCLCDAGYDVSLETSGALDIADVDPRVCRVVDIKAPGSGEVDKNRWENLALLRQGDELKFVLASEDDYRWACDLIRARQLSGRCPILFSPVADSLKPSDLADWIVRDRLPVRFQWQLHKLLWGSERGR